MSACASKPSVSQQDLSADELFHRWAKHHQDITNNVWQNSSSSLSYEDATFRVNLNHRKEAMRVLRCAKAQEGYESYAINQNPQQYELHYYFTGGNAKAKLSKCTHDPLFIANDAKYGFDELKAVFDEAISVLKAEDIATYPDIKRASSFRFYTKPYPPHILSEHPYVKIGVDKENIGDAKSILSRLLNLHEFLFVVEGQPIEDYLVETAVQ